MAEAGIHSYGAPIACWREVVGDPARGWTREDARVFELVCEGPWPRWTLGMLVRTLMCDVNDGVLMLRLTRAPGRGVAKLVAMAMEAGEP